MRRYTNISMSVISLGGVYTEDLLSSTIKFRYQHHLWYCLKMALLAGRSCLFVCVDVLQPSQPSGVMSCAVSLPNHTFTTKSTKWLTSIVHILSPETDNCPSWISKRERMTVENISRSISTKECCQPVQGLNLRPPGVQSDSTSNWATEASGAVLILNVEHSSI